MPRECRAILEDVDTNKKSRAAKIIKRTNIVASVAPQSAKSKSPSPEKEIRNQNQNSSGITDKFKMIQDQQIKQLA